MKKVITILVVVILLATTLAITVPASAAKPDRGVLIEAVLIKSPHPSPSGPVGVIFGKATVYDNFEVLLEVQDEDAPDVTYVVKISYGFPDNRMSENLGTITADGTGKVEGWFDLTGLPNPPGGWPTDATFLPGPGFVLIRPNPDYPSVPPAPPVPPGIIYHTIIIIPHPPAP